MVLGHGAHMVWLFRDSSLIKNNTTVTTVTIIFVLVQLRELRLFLSCCSPLRFLSLVLTLKVLSL